MPKFIQKYQCLFCSSLFNTEEKASEHEKVVAKIQMQRNAKHANILFPIIIATGFAIVDQKMVRVRTNILIMH